MVAFATSFGYINTIVTYVTTIVTYMTTHKKIMTKITHRTNLIMIVKIINLNTSHIYNRNYMVGMDKISFNDI